MIELLQEQGGATALQMLPDYLESANRWSDLLTYLQPEQLIGVLETSGSLRWVRQRVQQGWKAATTLNRRDAEFTFGLQQATLEEFYPSASVRMEVEARLELEGQAAALTIAQGAVLKEDRLELLARVGRAIRLRGGEVEGAILDEMRRLADEVDVGALKDRGIEIAADVLFSDADLAMSMVERVAGTRGTGNAVDLAFARLALAALDTPGDEAERARLLDRARSRIADPSVQRISTAASLLFGDYSAQRVIKEVEKAEARNRLFFLRQWVTKNRRAADAWEVVEYALDLLVRSTTETPTIRDLRELARALPHLDDEERLRRLVGRFDGQKGLAEALSASVDYVRLELLLAESEMRYDLDAASKRLLDVYWYVGAVKDLVTRSECLAWMLARWRRIDHDGRIEGREGLGSVLRDDFRKVRRAVLAESAAHLEVTTPWLGALAGREPEMALETVDAMNTQYRRDQGWVECVRGMVREGSGSLTRFEAMMSLLGRIRDEDEREVAIQETVRVLEDVDKIEDPVQTATIAKRVAEEIGRLGDGEARCRSYTQALSGLMRAPEGCGEVIEGVRAGLQAAWEGLDGEWRQVRAGYLIAQALATIVPEDAKKYLLAANTARERLVVEGGSPLARYIECVRLASRAYAGLLGAHVEREEELERLRSLIEAVPGRAERAELWADVAARAFRQGRSDVAEQLVVRWLRPLVDEIRDREPSVWRSVVLHSAGVMYRAHRATAVDRIEALPQPDRDIAWRVTCEFLVAKMPVHEPLSAQREAEMTHDVAIDVIEVLNRMKEDYTIARVVDLLTACASGRRSRVTLTRDQRADIARRLTEALNGRFPDPMNIQHDGYVTLCAVWVNRLRGVEQKVWDDLIAKARSIPNAADRVLVVSAIAEELGGRDLMRGMQLFNDARKWAEDLSSEIDRGERLAGLGEAASEIDITFSKECLRSAMTIVRGVEEGGLEQQRRILDIAHRIDSTFATSLAAMLDADDARSMARREADRRLSVLTARERMLEGELEVTADNGEELANAAALNLASLNGGRIEPVPMERLRSLLAKAAGVSLQHAYYVFAWYVENAVRRIRRPEDVVGQIRPLFESIALTGELTRRVSSSVGGRRRESVARGARVLSDDQELIVRAGEREEALRFVREWVQSNVRGYLKICDPYFKVEDMEAFKLVVATRPEVPISVLTSRRSLETVRQPWEETFRTHWRVGVSDHAPPDVEIIVVGGERSGEAPIHDRWWITEGSGLRFGTSFGSLGISKTAEVSILSREEAMGREAEIDAVMERRVRVHRGERLVSSRFNL